jgi:hypothetical protein
MSTSWTADHVQLSIMLHEAILLLEGGGVARGGAQNLLIKQKCVTSGLV